MAIDWTKVKYFKETDFICPDACGLNNPYPSVVWDIDECRGAVNQPLVITSACRCAAYEAAKGLGLPSGELSPHGPSPNDGFCKAIDILCQSDSLRFRIVVFFLNKGYRRIEVGSQHIHVDSATDFRPSPYFGWAAE